MKLIEDNDAWKWYKKALDVERKYEHRHNGMPNSYPCKVESEFWDDPNGPYTYNHSFIYQQEATCEKCGHKTKEWNV